MTTYYKKHDRSIVQTHEQQYTEKYLGATSALLLTIIFLRLACRQQSQAHSKSLLKSKAKPFSASAVSNSQGLCACSVDKCCSSGTPGLDQRCIWIHTFSPWLTVRKHSVARVIANSGKSMPSFTVFTAQSWSHKESLKYCCAQPPVLLHCLHELGRLSLTGESLNC